MENEFEGEVEDEEIIFESIDAETDYLIDQIDAYPKKIKYGVYRKIREYVSFINVKKEKIKSEALRWYILSYVVPIYLFVIGEPGLHASTSLTLFFVEITIMLFVSILWYRDCWLSHKDLSILYNLGKSLEESSDILGSAYQNMSKMLHGRFLDPNILDTVRYIINLMICSVSGLFGLGRFFDWNLGVVVVYVLAWSIWAASLLTCSILSGGSRFTAEKGASKAVLEKLLK